MPTQQTPAVHGDEKPPNTSRPGGPRGRALLVWAAVIVAAGVMCGILVGVALAPAPTSDVVPGAEAPPEPVPTETTPPSTTAEGVRELVFAASATRPEETPDALDAGLTQVFCFFSAPDLKPVQNIQAVWLHEAGRREDATASIALDEGLDHLSGHAVLSPPGEAKAFEPGIYEMALTADGLGVTEGSFAVIEDATNVLTVPQGMERYQPEVKALVVTSMPPPAKPKAEHLVLPANPARVTVTFDYAHAVPGTALYVGWTYGDGLIAQATTELNIQTESGKGEAWFGAQPEGVLPAGMYSVFVATNPDAPPLARTRFWIGREPRRDEITPVQ